ncbi:MAG: hypothetical protein HWE10_03755 [Gammaproteobacteria bacterium]|nr:hypothetical protein [Gammaproteobacteria bacterium]
MKPTEPEELITKFLEMDDYEFSSEETYKVVCECLERLHGYYGFDGWEFSDNWVFESLLPDWDKVDSSIDNIEKLISHTDSCFFNMSGSVVIDLYMGKSLTKYANKPLYIRNGRLLTRLNEEIYPLLLTLKVLLPVCFDKELEPNTVVLGTKLFGCADKIRMMTSLNLLWLNERNRHINERTTLDARMDEFDSRSVNKIRFEALETFVYPVLLDDESLSIDEIRKVIVKDYEEELERLYHKNEITDSDVGESEDVTKVSKSVVTRWIDKIRTDYLEN